MSDADRERSRDMVRKLLPALEALNETVRRKIPAETWPEQEIEREAEEMLETMREFVRDTPEPWTQDEGTPQP